MTGVQTCALPICLYLVKQIAEKHHGRIQIESKLGEGTNVMVLLPYIDAYKQEENPHAPQ